MTQYAKVLLLMAIIGSLSACSSINVDEILPDQSVAYQREKQAGRNLEIPPDLTTTRINDRMNVPNSSGTATNYSELVTDRRLRDVGATTRPQGAVLPENATVSVKREGDARWLLIQGSVDAVWDRMLDFWQDQGVLLEQQDAALGIMRTTWLDNRANIARDFISDAVRKAFDGLYETSLRDQYRIRLERLPNQQTEVYLTHYGMEEKLITDSEDAVENTVWVPRQRDPELEIVMLRRMMLFLGTADERARAQLAARNTPQVAQAKLVKDREGNTGLVIGKRFDRAWRLVGLVLDRVGFAVEDRNRAQGVYYVRYNDPVAEVEEGGFWSAFKFWGDDKPARNTDYQIRVVEQQGASVVTVLNDKGELDKTNTSTRILTLMQEQLQ